MTTQNDTVAEVVGAEVMSVEDINAKLAELLEFQKENEEIVRAHNRAQAKIRELESQKRAQVWIAWLDSAPEDLRETPEMNQLKAFCFGGIQGNVQQVIRQFKGQRRHQDPDQ